MSECGFHIERGSYFIGPCRLEAGHAGAHHPQTEAESQAERDYVNRLLKEETGYGFDPIAGATPTEDVGEVEVHDWGGHHPGDGHGGTGSVASTHMRTVDP